MNKVNFSSMQRLDTVYVAVLVVLSIMLLRLVSLGLYPLYDTTEARYGEMARLMFETKNWITPLFDYEIPFWGKPPLHTWMSAGSFSLLGVNEFSARVPHFISGLMTMCLVFYFVKTITGKKQAIASSLVLCTSLGFIVAIGMVMTDSALLFAYTLALVSFWLNFVGRNRQLNGHLFFVALSLGMLIKGPVSVVLIVIALLTWSFWQRNFIVAIKSLPWKTGLVLLSLLTFPWYIAAEISTPGFLEYFIVGEHIQRFLVSGWEGDLYGTAHDKPRGIIWFYWLICAFPWSFVFIYRLYEGINTEKIVKRSRHSHHDNCESNNRLNSKQALNRYLVCFMVAPMMLFSLAGNILPIYVLPGFGALAIYLAMNTVLNKSQLKIASITLVLLSMVLVVIIFGLVKKTSEGQLLLPQINKYSHQKVYYWQKRPFSAQFYSQGRAVLLTKQQDLKEKLLLEHRFYFVVKRNELESIQTVLSGQCVELKAMKKRILYQCN